jgi:peptidoglycan/xylan/chitin deacetylase (PgdA/CDA1 family)
MPEAMAGRGTVCLTFDFDAVSLWISRQMVTPGPISRGEFGAYALPRIFDLLDAAGVPSTWFIPGHTVETYPRQCRDVVAAGHEVALHGYLHELVSQLTPEEERRVFEKSYDILSGLTGRSPEGSRTPSWDFSESTLQIMLDLGLKYDSSLMSTDYTPFYCRLGDVVSTSGPMQFGQPAELVELPVSWSLDDYPHFEYLRTGNLAMPGLRRANEVFENFRDDVAYMVKNMVDGVLVITFHPQVIGRGHRMLALERFVSEVKDMGLEFETLARVADRFRKGRPYGQSSAHGR